MYHTTRTHTDTHRDTHTHTHTHSHRHTCTHTHTDTHTLTHRHTHSHTHARTHTHTLTHTSYIFTCSELHTGLQSVLSLLRALVWGLCCLPTYPCRLSQRATLVLTAHQCPQQGKNLSPPGESLVRLLRAGVVAPPLNPVPTAPGDPVVVVAVSLTTRC